MSRSVQISKSGLFHVLNRGILKQTIFHAIEDYSSFFETLRRYAMRSQAAVYHWCLMPNHYHVVLELRETKELSKLVGGLQQVYAVGYHKRHETAGRLFQSRFKSQAIQKETYLLACGRYVEQNPVRAGLCNHAWDWPWSSARFYVTGQADRLTTLDPLWGDRAMDAYMSWLEQRSEGQEELFASSTEFVGDEHFRARLHRVGGRLTHRGPGRRPDVKN
jgi:putative transposase